MTLRELINQVTDNDSESPVLDYVLQPYYKVSYSTTKMDEKEILNIDIDHSVKKIYVETEE